MDDLKFAIIIGWISTTLFFTTFVFCVITSFVLFNLAINWNEEIITYYLMGFTVCLLGMSGWMILQTTLENMKRYNSKELKGDKNEQ